MRHLTPIDRLISTFDNALRTVVGGATESHRPRPGADRPDGDLTESDRRHVAGLIRVDHAGEVAAQALYMGQALTARNPDTAQAMEHAANEEGDHLAWCESRLSELGAHRSLLTPFWYGGSFAIGALAGVSGDRWSLGFVVETEQQVMAHLDDHLGRLPSDDEADRLLLEQMREDESAHALAALEAGATDLPAPIKGVMQGVSRLMTVTAYRL